MEELKFTQEQLDTLINEKVSEAKKGLYTEEDLTRKVTSEVDRRVESGIQKGLETQKKKWESEFSERAKMSAEELARKDFDEKMKLVAEKERELSIKANNLEAMSMLSGAGVPKSHYEKFINILVSDDNEVTKTNVQNFIDMFNATKNEIETKVKSEFTNIPKPTTGGTGGAITKTDFINMGYAEKIRFKQENPELYKQFMK